jgi:hypothetical protein
LETNICLFDVDGVLVQPGGYRAAVRATLEYFLGRMGLVHLTPGEEIPVLFESMGVTSEWDMVPITLAVVMNSICVENEPDQPLHSLTSFLDWAKALNSDLPVDLAVEIRRLAPAFQGAEIPAEAILQNVSSGSDREFLPHLTIALLNEILGNSRDINISQVTKVFQNIVLGSADYKTVYGQPAEFERSSCLKEYDRVLIEPGVYSRLRQQRLDGNLFYAAYTARPSLPPKEVNIDVRGFSPEAEQGLVLVDPQLMPLIGYGRLRYLADQVGVKADAILKPAPVQALAALAAAITGEEWLSLQWAWQVFSSYGGDHDAFATGAQRSELWRRLPSSFALHVFEDSSIGITAGRRAADILCETGLNVEFHAWGIAEDEGKRQALLAVGAEIFPDVNAALRTGFAWL